MGQSIGRIEAVAKSGLPYSRKHVIPSSRQATIPDSITSIGMSLFPDPFLKCNFVLTIQTNPLAKTQNRQT